MNNYCFNAHALLKLAKSIMRNSKEAPKNKELEPTVAGKELHAHLSGSANPSDIFDIILQNDLHIREGEMINSITQQFGIRLADAITINPAEAKQKFSKAYVCGANGTHRFEEVMQRFSLTSLLLKYPEIRTQLAKAACEDFKANGVNYVEWRIDPFSSTRNETAQEGLEKLSDFYSGMKSVDLTSNLVLSFSRSRYRRPDGSIDHSKITFLTKQLEDLLAAKKDLPIVDLDFSGDEVVPLAYFRPIFDLAYRKKLGVVPHVGEGETSTLEDGFADVETALDVGSKRLGHAIVVYAPLNKYLGRHDHLGRLYDRQRIDRLRSRQNETMARIRTEGIPIEVCPTSNLTAHLGLKSFKQHPIDKLIEEHVPFVICSDDPGIFGTTLRKEVSGIAQIKNLDANHILESANQFALA